MHVFCDFDGTISTADTTLAILERLADPRWREIEDDWIEDRIDAAACMRAQTALITGDDASLDAALDEIEIDPGFASFIDWCRTEGVPVTIVSDGVDYFIRRILKRHGLGGLEVVSNRLEGSQGARGLSHPHQRQGCAAGAGVCKCAALDAGVARPIVYVGDGRSDFCVSARVDLLFAKGALAAYAEGRSRPFVGFQTFEDVTKHLARLVQTRRAAS